MILITIDNNKDAFRIRMNKSRTRVLGKNHFWGSPTKSGVLGKLAKLFGIR